MAWCVQSALKKPLQSGILYPEKSSFRIEKESFTDKQKIKEFTTTKLALQNLLEGLFQSENKWWQF